MEYLRLGQFDSVRRLSFLSFGLEVTEKNVVDLFLSSKGRLAMRNRQ